jgi:hypothetical protein
MEFASAYAYVGKREKEKYKAEVLKKRKINRKQRLVKNSSSSDSEEKLQIDLSLSESSSESLSGSGSSHDDETRQVTRADTNIIALNLGSLEIEGTTLFTGDPTFCENCQSVFSFLSILEERGSAQWWKCEFCDFENEVFMDENEIPKNESVDYILEPPIVNKVGDDESIVVFCIDTSGSMCSTSEVSSSQFKMKKKAVPNEFSQFMDGSDQYFPGQRKDVVYVSRLECVQAAVDQQLENFKQQFPNKRIVIVDFNSEVTIHDVNRKHTIAGDRLNDANYLRNAVSGLNLDLSVDALTGYDALSKTVFSLEEKGQTALGPALLISTSIASLRPGSTVVLCTDGLANIGLGAFEEASPNEMDAIEKFYVDAANEAKNNGVSVSIISIQGTTVNLEYIAKVATITNGMNDIVNPLNLSKNFNFLMENPVIATNVSVKMHLHTGLSLVNEENPINSHSCLRQIGNANHETTISFEYTKSETHDLTGKDKLPFQVQINYSRLDGAKCVRVVAKQQDVTESREMAEDNINVAVVGIHTVQQTAKLTEEGDYTKARMTSLTNKRMVKKALKKKSNIQDRELKQYNVWMAETEKIDKAIVGAQDDERAYGDAYDSNSDDSTEKEKTVNYSKKMERLKGRKARRTQQDQFSNVMHQQQKPKYSYYF